MENERRKRLSEISSFKDFRLESENLDLRSRMIEAKLRLNYMEFTERFSLKNIFNSLAKETVLPGISDLLGELIKKVDKNIPHENERSQEE